MGKIHDIGETKAIELLAHGDVMGAISSLGRTCEICLSRNAMPQKDEFFCDRCKIEALERHLKGENKEVAATQAPVVQKVRWSETRVESSSGKMVVKQRTVRTTTRYQVHTIVKEEEVETYYQFTPNGTKWMKFRKNPKKAKRRSILVNTETEM